MTEIELFFVLLFLLYNCAAKSQVIEDFVFVRRVHFEKKKLVDKIPPEEKLDWIKINV